MRLCFIKCNEKILQNNCVFKDFSYICIDYRLLTYVIGSQIKIIAISHAAAF